MNSERKVAVRAEALKLLRLLFRESGIDRDDRNALFSFLADAPFAAAKKAGLKLVEVPEVPPHLANFEVAGVFDRNKETITLAQKFSLPSRRFTLSHELAHYHLHKGLTMFRDRPIRSDNEYHPPRLEQEQEADIWAAEFLMPSELVKDEFASRFGPVIEGHLPSTSLLFWLQANHRLHPDARRLFAPDPSYRALLISKASVFNGAVFRPLHARFGVSPTAMSIQLMTLGRVK